MATFGNTAAATGTSTSAAATLENHVNGAKFTLSEAGLPTSMTMSVLCATDNKKMRMAVYRDSDKALMAETEQVTVIANSSRQTVTMNFLRTFNLPAADYWLMGWSEAAGGGAELGNSGLSGGDLSGQSQTYVADGERFPVTISPVNVGGFPGDDQICIYCTYTPGTAKTLGSEQRQSAFNANIENMMYAGRFTMPAGNNGTVNDFWCWITPTGSGATANVTIKAAIYRDDTDALVAQSDELTIVDGDPPQWRKPIFSTPPTLSASGTYYLVIWSAISTNYGINATLASSGGLDVWSRALTYGAWPDPHGMAQDVANGLMSIYLTYTEVPSGNVIPVNLNGGMMEYRGGMRG